MELKNICDKLINFFDIEDIGYLGDKIASIMFSTEKDAIYDKYIEIVKDLDIDWIQKIFQYYKSNREDLKQDYTPKCLSNLMAKLANHKDAKTALDVCCGSGSLIIELFKINPILNFTGIELDPNVIPFLLFNLSIHNINATIIRGNVTTGERYEIYKLTSTEKYSKIETLEDYDIGEYDIIISNPPYHLKMPTVEIMGQNIKKSSEAFFTLYYIKYLASNGRCSIIFPAGFLTSKNKEDLFVRKYLLENGMLNSAISNPENMFESTGTTTCIINIQKGNNQDSVVLIDSSNCHDIWVREQRGQFGGAAHTNRVYKKSFNTYNEDNIEKILTTIKDRLAINKSIREFEEDYSVIPTIAEIKENGYSISAGQYFKPVTEYIDINQEQLNGLIGNLFSLFDTSGMQGMLNILENDDTILKNISEEEKSELENCKNELRNYINDTNNSYNKIKDLLKSAKLKTKEELAQENDCTVEDLRFVPYEESSTDTAEEQSIEDMFNSTNKSLSACRDKLMPLLLMSQMQI